MAFKFNNQYFRMLRTECAGLQLAKDIAPALVILSDQQCFLWKVLKSFIGLDSIGQLWRRTHCSIIGIKLILVIKAWVKNQSLICLVHIGSPAIALGVLMQTVC